MPNIKLSKDRWKFNTTDELRQIVRDELELLMEEASHHDNDIFCLFAVLITIQDQMDKYNQMNTFDQLMEKYTITKKGDTYHE